MVTNENEFDNYKVGSLYMFHGEIAEVVGHSECNSMKSAKRDGRALRTECIGCKGYSHFKTENGNIDMTCAHNGNLSLVRMRKYLPTTNMRW